MFILSNGITFAEENITEQVNDTAETIFEDTVAEDVDTTETTTSQVTETTSQVTQTATIPTPGQTPKSPGFGSFITIVALIYKCEYIMCCKCYLYSFIIFIPSINVEI